MSHQVASRRRELGIRRALGAGTGRIVFLVLEDSVALLGLGILVGGLLAVGMFRVLGALFFGLPMPGLGLLAGVAAFFAVVAGLAGLSPTRTTLGVEPVEAIRAE